MKGTDDENEDYEFLNNFKRIPSQYDESVEVVGADDILSPPSSAGLSGQKDFVRENNSPIQIAKEKEKISKSAKTSQWQNKSRGSMSNLSDNSENSEDDEDDDDDDVRAPIIHGAYDPGEYEQLAVPEEIKDIFNYITKYTPQNIELDNKLCPFLPDFIPAVGDIDAFIKVPRPDGKKDGLGLTVLDEPCTQQSDPAVLQLQLRAVARQTSAKSVVVKKIENAEKNVKSIERWIKAISDLHSKKPSPTVQYTNGMPSMDNLMQEWPQEIEERLSATALPSPDLDCDLSTYVTIICNFIQCRVLPIMGESSFEKASNLLNNALQLAVSTALRLVELPNSEPEKVGREKVQRTLDLSMERLSSGLPEISFDQISWHDHCDDCWIVLYDRVYDVTKFLREHPGGADVLVEYAGRDATLAYRGFGHSAEAWQILQKYLIGVLPEEERTGIFKEEKLIGRNPQLRAASS